MTLRILTCFFALIYLSGCADHLNEEPDGDSQSLDANKNLSPTIIVDSICTKPCTVSLEGLDYQLLQGIDYIADGTPVGRSVNWWSKYDLTLPSNLNGQIFLEARVVNIFGSVIATDVTMVNIVSGSSNQPTTNTHAAGAHITTADTCENPCELSVSTHSSTDIVEYEADGYYLGSASEYDGYSISYEFYQVGPRSITATAFGADGSVIGQDTKTIRVVNPQATQPSPSPSPSPGRSTAGVPYFNQYNNALSPGASCQNTSIAMVLAYLGWQGVPDDITRRYGKDLAQSPAGLAQVFNAYAQENWFSERLNPNTNGTLSGLRAELDRGQPVIIHGYFTGYGHVVVVVGYDQGGYYVNDPAGRWSERFKGGYSGGGSGHNTYYSRAAFEAAVATADGYSSLPLWYHSLR